MLTRLLRACLLSLALGATGASLAVPLMEMRAEDLLPMTAEFKQSLHLNANQQTLWQQVDSRSRAVLRERQQRRIALQEKAKSLLANPDLELRELNALVDAESAASAQEDKQLREWWLSLNDALDDAQRRQVATLLGEQLLRVVPEARPGGERGGRGGEKGGERGGRGMGNHGRGGMGGPGGISIGG
ncbi:hypothetical protein ACFQ09_15280 [Massilia norwichensis]|uniref:Zinc resistance-associated protein n=1 Tax=Massilia norwichensis TaxID=1442366 RepID=A0ABT2AA06_9BURK|nr:hypothetical protein [Massilia norwichensis]MCS0591021.1 hypothetical protein [Massilia norwichensis]